MKIYYVAESGSSGSGGKKRLLWVEPTFLVRKSEHFLYMSEQMS